MMTDCMTLYANDSISFGHEEASGVLVRPFFSAKHYLITVSSKDAKKFNEVALNKIAYAKKTKPDKEFSSPKEFFTWLRSTRD